MTAPKLEIQVTFEVDSCDVAKIQAWSIEELQGKIWEATEVQVPVTLQFGQTTVRGKVRFLAPTPFELKRAAKE